MINRYTLHFDIDIMVSGFGVSDSLIDECANAVASVLKSNARTDKNPIIIKNAYDDFFGKSANILL